jgi:hypothetical protein
MSQSSTDMPLAIAEDCLLDIAQLRAHPQLLGAVGRIQRCPGASTV